MFPTLLSFRLAVTRLNSLVIVFVLFLHDTTFGSAELCFLARLPAAFLLRNSLYVSHALSLSATYYTTIVDCIVFQYRFLCFAKVRTKPSFVT